MVKPAPSPWNEPENEPDKMLEGEIKVVNVPDPENEPVIPEVTINEPVISESVFT